MIQQDQIIALLFAALAVFLVRLATGRGLFTALYERICGPRDKTKADDPDQ